MTPTELVIILGDCPSFVPVDESHFVGDKPLFTVESVKTRCSDLGLHDLVKMANTGNDQIVFADGGTNDAFGLFVKHYELD